MLAKILLWAVATFLAGLFAFFAGNTDDASFGDVSFDGSAVCVFLAFAAVVVALWAGISAFAVLALPWFVKVLIYVVVIVVTLVLIGLIKNRFRL